MPPDSPLASPRASAPSGRVRRWLPWLLGLALLTGVILAALHLSEAQQFAALVEAAHPWWLAVAALLQVATYVAEAEGWRTSLRHGGASLSREGPAGANGPEAGLPASLPIGVALRLSLTKLFVDQALPSAGISGTTVVAQSLLARGIARATVMAAVIIDLAAYYSAYAVCLAAALVLAIAYDQAAGWALAVGLGFLLFAIGIVALVLLRAGRGRGTFGHRLARFKPLALVLSVLEDADPKLAHNPRVLAMTTAWQAAIFLLDGATVWVLVMALGATASPAGVFASYMLASLFRTVGIVPAGLGTFEATSTLTLNALGIPLPVALAATLLYRGLSFWIPLPLGLWFTRKTAAHAKGTAPTPLVPAPWSVPLPALLTTYASAPNGLTSSVAADRLRLYGPNALRAQRPVSRLSVLLRQLRSPLLLLLVAAAIVAFLSRAWVDASIVLGIVVISAGIGFQREYVAQRDALRLQSRVKTRATVPRDGRPEQHPIDALVPGDVILLGAGSLVPADAIILEATDCHLSEAVLTGESFPLEKVAGEVRADAPMGQRTNMVFLGTNVRSGTARALVVATGTHTEFGAIAHRLSLRPPETEFDRGIRRFGYLLSIAMLAMVLVVFVAHVLEGRPPVETLLFAVALAVGLSPELLPAILSVNLARGAQRMAKHGVLVRHLNAIENLGSMDILCTDKTGTLTEGVVQVDGAWDPSGAAADDVLALAALNAGLGTGLANPLDEAILGTRAPALEGVEKRAEIPFDFMRKRASVVVAERDVTRLITKGAVQHVLDVCTEVAGGGPLDAATRAALEARVDAWNAQGIRVVAVATRTLRAQPRYGRDDERALVLAGFVTFLDRPKAGVAAALATLSKLGVQVKLITGDSRAVATHVAKMVGLPASGAPLAVLTGEALEQLHDEALWQAAERTDIFAEVDPNQKERIILSLKKMGHVVGFMGDGVNDAPAMHAADTSLSVEHAVDVAREAADFVLLESDLDVIRAGIEEGRRTFANTLKYVLTTTSANLGNMVSMAVASLFLTFLPLTAGQILLNNFLSDIPAFGLASDSVDPELIAKPRRWNIRFIGRFMVEFGVLSSAFDFLTFAVLLAGFHTAPDAFRTGWFVESLLTELVIALVVRTRRLSFRSRPGRLLLVSSVALVAFAFVLPYLPFSTVFGFVPLPAPMLLVIAAITVGYVLATEAMKRWFYRHEP